MKVFISKYALTQGIFETDVKTFNKDEMCQETKDHTWIGGQDFGGVFL